MKKIVSISLVLVVVTVLGVTYAMAGQNYTVDKSDYVNSQNLIANIPASPLSEEEVKSLIQMREEEKLARDVYITLAKMWNLNIFSNISKSEETHMNAIKALLDRYNLEDPVKSDEVGVFTSEEMQKLYNDLIAEGSKSLIDALKVGATVEDLDIKDLEDFLKVTDNDDIKIIYQNLTKGSRNHLRAFMRNIKANGGTYEPQFISKEEFDKILASDMERGAVDKDGKLMNRGQGNGNEKGQGNGNGKGKGNGQGNGNGHGQGNGHHHGNGKHNKRK